MQTNTQRQALVIFALFLPLYALVAWRNPWRMEGTLPLLFFANAVIIAHVTLGAYVMQAHLQASAAPRHIVLDTGMLALLYASVWTMSNLLWFSALYGLFFSLAIFKYMQLSKQAKSVAAVDYIHLKIRNESPVVPLLFAVTFLAYVFRHQEMVMTALQTATLAMALGFLLWLVVVKRAYHWVFKK